MFDSICLAMDKQRDGIVAIEHKMLKRLLKCNKKRENASIPVAVECERSIWMDVPQHKCSQDWRYFEWHPMHAKNVNVADRKKHLRLHVLFGSALRSSSP